MTLLRWCPKCRTSKPPSEYYRRPGGNFTGHCAPCHRAGTRSARLKREFGLTLEDYDRMLEEQGEVCAICGCEPWEQGIDPRTDEPRLLAVDHNHETGQVRGLLCGNCNRGLGMFGEDVERIDAAIAYLEEHRAVQV